MPLDGPGQVDGRRAGRLEQLGALGGEVSSIAPDVAAVLSEARARQRHPERGRRADRRRAAHLHGPDRVGDLVRRSDTRPSAPRPVRRSDRSAERRCPGSRRCASVVAGLLVLSVVWTIVARRAVAGCWIRWSAWWRATKKALRREPCADDRRFSSSRTRAASCRNWHLPARRSVGRERGLPGFVGPVPPPLLIRARESSVVGAAFRLAAGQIGGEYTRNSRNERQLVSDRRRPALHGPARSSDIRRISACRSPMPSAHR